MGDVFSTLQRPVVELFIRWSRLTMIMVMTNGEKIGRYLLEHHSKMRKGKRFERIQQHFAIIVVPAQSSSFEEISDF